MSIEASGWAWQQEIPTHLKLTLVALSDWADPTGYCWPAVETIAERVGAGYSTVKRHLSELESMGLLEKVKRRRARDGSLRQWEYQLLLDETFVAEPTLGLTDEPKEEEPRAHGRENLGLTGEPAEEPPLEPPVTPLSGEPDEEEPGMTHREAFDTIAEACGLDAEAVRATGGALIGKAASTIRGLTDDPAEVHARAQEYRRQHPEWDLTPAALVKWWPTLETATTSAAGTCECGQSLRQHDPVAHDLILT